MSAETVSSTKTVDLYMPLRNEGTEVLRPTKGLLLECDAVQVLATADYDPAIEEWEFPPGTKVKCVMEDRGNRRGVSCAASDRWITFLESTCLSKCSTAAPFSAPPAFASGLPLLDAMIPIGLGQEQRAAAARPRRMVLIGRPLGLHTPFLFPERAGRDYAHTRYTRILDAHRNQLTVFSGMSHRGYTDGHHNDVALMTGAPPEGIRLNDLRNTISLDQEVASHIGSQTRFASLVLGGTVYSWNRRGVRVPRAALGQRRLSAAVHPGHAGGDRPRGAPPARWPQHSRRPARPGAHACRKNSAPPIANVSTFS